MKAKWALSLLALFLVLVLCAAVFPLEQFLEGMQEWTAANPSLAAWAVGAAFLVGVLFLLPVSPIVMMAGFLFGTVKGFALIWGTGLVASSLAFWIGRRAARQWVERKLRNRTIFLAVDRAIGRHGLWVVLLTRLAMVFPYGPLNYSFGLSSVRYRDFLIGTNIGMVAPMLLVVYIGTTASSVASLFGEGLKPERHMMLLNLVALAVVALVVGLIARSALKLLREEMAAKPEPETRAPEGEN